MSNKTYIAFDIETSAIPYDTFSDSQKEYLIRGASTEEDIQKKLSEMGLSPLTAKVVTIGMKIIEEESDAIKNVALMTNPEHSDSDEPLIENVENTTFYQTSEPNVLRTFWKILKKHNNAILLTFNGRNFDCPFVMLRSAILQESPSRNLMDGTKFNYYNHIDLADELTFYQPSSYGATKRFNFDFYTRAFGLVSPKSEGIDGSLVTEFFNKGDYKTIAEYCLRDVDATWNLFLRIKDFIHIK